MSTKETPRWMEDSELPAELNRILRSADSDATPEQVARLEARLGSLLSPQSPPSSGTPSAGHGPTGENAVNSVSSSNATSALSSWFSGAKAFLFAGTIALGAVLIWHHADSRETRKPRVASQSTTHPSRPSQFETRLQPGETSSTREKTAPQENTSTHLSPLAPIKRERPGLTEEARMLAAAQTALDHHPEQTLSIVREHKTRFPRGNLAEERELLAMEAHKRLGHGDAMRALAIAFIRKYPHSGHLPRVRRLLAESNDGQAHGAAK